MATITKERNLLKIQYEDKNAPYIFDISTGIMLGLTGQPLKNNPNGMISVISDHYNESNVIHCMYALHDRYGCKYVNMARHIALLAFWDKLDSIGYNETYWHNFTNTNLMNFIDKNFKKFAKALRDEPNLTIGEFKERYQGELWAKENNIKVDEYFTPEMCAHLRQWAFNTKEKNACAVYYIKKGLIETVSSHTARNLLSSYFTYCDGLEWEYQRGDFIRVYAEAKRTYEARKEEIDKKALERNQLRNKKALEFSYGGLSVVIPTTREEFHIEAEYQSNCVERLYLPKVLRNETNVVFIRRDTNPSAPYITCEVYKGQIWQYLTRFNSYPTEDIAEEFKNAYARHLNEFWVAD